MKEKHFEQYKRIFRFFQGLLTLGCMSCVFGYMWFEYINELNEKPFTGKGNLMEVAVFFVILFFAVKIFGGFEVGFYTVLNVVLSEVLALFCVNGIMAVQIVLTIGSLYSIGKICLYLLITFGIQIVLAIILVSLFDAIYTHMFPAWNILLIYENDSVRLFEDKVNTRKDKYVIGGKVHIKEGVENICKMIDEYDSVLIYDVSSVYRNDIIKYCYGEGVRVYQTPKISDILIRSASEHHLFDSPLLMSRNIGLSFEQRFIKRFLDIVISLVFIVITSPVMLITAICIKLEDHGPVMFMQKRATLNNKEFMICKFRSMIVDAEADGKARPATNDDDRITKVGRFIRKTRIDELPQFFNVLKGDMSLVGPRPERVEHVEKYSKEIPEFRFRTKVKGGLTGYAQVYGKYNTTAYDKLKLDLMYIENYSLALDFRIVIMTIKVIFMKSSTEGFEDTSKKE